MDDAPKQGKGNSLKRNEEKWSKSVLDAGFLVLPSVLLERQVALELDSIDMNILLHLMRFWWFKDRLPYPTKRTIAECMKISQSTVQRRIARMEKRGLVNRRRRTDASESQVSNHYDLTGLVARAQELAGEELQVRDRRRKADNDRRLRKTPRKRSSPREQGVVGNGSAR